MITVAFRTTLRPIRRLPFHSRSFRSTTTAASINDDTTGKTYQIKSTTPHNTQYDTLNKSSGLQGSYDPSSFESKVYEWWEKAGCFDPDSKSGRKGGEPYVLPMPPPNVTGRLHMGHAIFVALQDVLARFHRMRGKSVLWTPGTDHAGIATQLQVCLF
jgi:valyl-tRNA synthetase